LTEPAIPGRIYPETLKLEVIDFDDQVMVLDSTAIVRVRQSGSVGQVRG